jgi:hypothetical protein
LGTPTKRKIQLHEQLSTSRGPNLLPPILEMAVTVLWEVMWRIMVIVVAMFGFLTGLALCDRCFRREHCGVICRTWLTDYGLFVQGAKPDDRRISQSPMTKTFIFLQIPPRAVRQGRSTPSLQDASMSRIRVRISLHHSLMLLNWRDFLISLCLP